jgi:hypothetical protein
MQYITNYREELFLKRYSGTSDVERLSLRTNQFLNITPKQKKHQFPNRVSVLEQANWQPGM